MPTSTLAASAGLAVFKLLIKDIYEHLKPYPDVINALWSTRTGSQRIFSNIAEVKTVRTLLHLDKPVDLRIFYHPLHVQCHNKRFPIIDYSTFETNRNIIIRGVAGQGKSILLRYICLNELCAGKYLPLFIELRYISDSKSLDDILKDRFSEIGLKYSPALFNILAKSGRLMLLLDAFDEVYEKGRQDVAKQLDHLALTLPDVPIIITSRPNSEIFNSTQFDAYDLCDLHGTEYKAFVEKLLNDKPTSDALIRAIARNRQGIAGILTTPLLVTLLAVTYRSFQEVPAQMSGFYDDLFQLLLQRHDGMKLRYVRTRSCSLNDAEYRRAFEAFCFFSKAFGKSVFTQSEIFECANKALAECGYVADAIKIVSDIVNITCLLLRDGSDYRFLHKTVQEYYAAAFLKRAPDPVVAEFYRMAFREYYYTNPWQHEIAFLREIDEYRYNKYFAIGGAAAMFSVEASELMAVSDEQVRKAVMGEILTARFSVVFINGVRSAGINFIPPNLGFFSTFYVQAAASAGFFKGLEGLGADRMKALDALIMHRADSEVYTMSGAQCIKEPALAAALEAAFGIWVSAVRASVQAAVESLRKAENRDRFTSVFERARASGDQRG